MALWSLFGLRQGSATTLWPAPGGDAGQDGVLGMPRIDSAACAEGCDACRAACPTDAIRRDQAGAIEIDYGRCIACQLCVEACPTDAASSTSDWAFGVRDRSDLIRTKVPAQPTPPARTARFRRSLHIRHVDAGSCNGCESELQALNNPIYNFHRLGIFFTPSPRFADLLLVTGPVTHAMLEPLKAAYEAMPAPRWVMATGTCAVSGALTGGGRFLNNGLEDILPVDVWLPGCPPNPAAIIEALMMFLDRLPQRVHGGVHGD